jgi:hypothetical protein
MKLLTLKSRNRLHNEEKGKEIVRDFWQKKPGRLRNSRERAGNLLRNRQHVGCKFRIYPALGGCLRGGHTGGVGGRLLLTGKEKRCKHFGNYTVKDYCRQGAALRDGCVKMRFTASQSLKTLLTGGVW